MKQAATSTVSDRKRDLSGVLTVFVTTTGERSTPECLAALARQTVRFKSGIIPGGYEASMRTAADQCTTPYFAVVRSDVALDPDAIDRLFRGFIADPYGTMTVGALWDRQADDADQADALRLGRTDIGRRYDEPFLQLPRLALCREVALGELIPLPDRVVVPDGKDKPKVLFLSDVRDWAFDINGRDMAEWVPEFDFDFWYVTEATPWPDHFDTVYVPYHRWHGVNARLANGIYPKALGSLRSRWFRGEDPEPPRPTDIDLVNIHSAFHVVTLDNFLELAGYCPRVEYLTNPVNMRRFDQPTGLKDRVVASWNGNASHHHIKSVDVKGFNTIIKPACERAGMPLAVAEYGTSRISPADMPAFYRQANLAVSMSLYEGASNSVLESMASGHALITTDVGNVSEMRQAQLDHFGDTGIHVVERSEAALVDALVSFADKPKRICEMGTINRAEIEARWSWHAWRDRYAAFLVRGMNGAAY